MGQVNLTQLFASKKYFTIGHFSWPIMILKSEKKMAFYNGLFDLFLCWGFGNESTFPQKEVIRTLNF